MKVWLRLISFLMLVLSTGNAHTQIINNGGTLIIESGGLVKVEGNVSSTTNIQGNGTLVLDGTTSQELNMNGSIIPSLEINNASNVALKGSVKLNALLTFTNGKILTGAHRLTLASTASFTGADASKYIETNGTGEVIKEVTGAGNYILPIGNASGYLPLQYQLAGNTFGANAKVGAAVVSSPHPNKPIRSEDFLAAYWKVNYSNITGGLVNAFTAYTDVNGYTGTETLLNGLRWNGSNWAQAGSTINHAINEITYTNVISGTELYAMNKFVYAGAKVFLQGAYNAATNKMDDHLRAGTNLIPLTDPYRSILYSQNFSHTGNAVVETANASVFADKQNADKNIVDWVFLELRDAAYVLLQTRSALLQKDGTIVDVDGSNPVYFKNINEGNYVLTVRHRNHLGIGADAKAFAKTLDESIPVSANIFDFTIATDAQIFGTATAYNVINGLNMMWAGNVNSNQNVKYSGPANDDVFLLSNILGGNETAILNNVYSAGDINLDRVVKYTSTANDHAVLLTMVLGGSGTKIITQQIPF